MGSNTNGAIVNDSYAKGNIDGNIDTGGLVGGNDNGSITNSYTTAKVSGKRRIGGLVGENINDNNDKIIRNSFYDKNIVRRSAKGKGTGKSTELMKQKFTYENWDFENVWQIDDRISYPTLQWEN